MDNLSLRDWMSDSGVTKWIQALGIIDAPSRRAGIKTSLQFFQQEMPALPICRAKSFLAAMDLSRKVAPIVLHKGEKVIAFRNRAESEYKLFYTRPGASIYRSGINPHGRIAIQYSVLKITPALESHTTGVIDVWSIPAAFQHLSVAPLATDFGVMASGGGVQLVIPAAARNLAITRVGT